MIGEVGHRRIHQPAQQPGNMVFGPQSGPSVELPEQRERRLHRLFYILHSLAVNHNPRVSDAVEQADRLHALDAEHECPHDRLYGDRTPACGCWGTEERQRSCAPPILPQQAQTGGGTLGDLLERGRAA